MNIIIANTQEFNPLLGGVERISGLMANEFIKKGHKVIFVACIVSRYSSEYLPSAKQYILPQIEYNCDENIEAFKNIIVQEGIDVVLNQAGNIKGFTALCVQAVCGRAKERIPLVSAIHINPEYMIESLRDFRYSRIYPLSYAKALRRLLLYPFRRERALMLTRDTYSYVCEQSSAVVVLSEQYIEQLKSYVNERDWNKIVSIGNSLNVGSGYNKDKKNIVLYVGRIDFDHKRTDRILEIWKTVYKRYPDWKLRLVGDGPIKNVLETYTAQKNIGNVTFTGMKDPSEEYEKASILCMTSTIEGFPMVLLEGMSRGCVPISYDSYAAIYDIIENNVNGIIVPKFKKFKYKKELCSLMDSEALRVRLGEEAANIINKYSSEEITDQWLNLLEKLC